MALYSDDLQVSHLAAESTHNTAVTADKQLPNTKLLLAPAGAPNGEYTADGHLYPSDNTNNLEWGAGKWNAPPTFDESAYVFDSLYGIAVPTGAGVAKTRVWTPAVAAADNYCSYSVERGQTGALSKYAGVVFNTHHMVVAKRDKPMMDGDLWGQNALPATVFTAPSPTVVHSTPISNMMFNLYYASTWALLGSAPVALTGQFRLEYTFGPKYGDAAFIGSAAQSYDALGIIVPNTKVLLTLPFDVSGSDFVGQLNLSKKRGGSPVYIRLEALGLLLEAGKTETFRMDMVLQARNVPNMNQIDKAKFVGLQWECGLFIDEIAQKALELTTISSTVAV